MPDVERFSAAGLIDFVSQALQRFDVPPEDARVTAEILVEADLMGIESHGVAHLMVHPSYVLGFKQGVVNPRPNIRVVHETPSTALVDGDGGLGPVVGHRAMSIAIQKAKECGTGMVAATRSRHYGIAGYYALMAVPHDMIGLAFTNSPPFVAPTFARGRMLGTNPIAVAVPTRQRLSLPAGHGHQRCLSRQVRGRQARGQAHPPHLGGGRRGQPLRRYDPHHEPGLAPAARLDAGGRLLQGLRPGDGRRHPVRRPVRRGAQPAHRVHQARGGPFLRRRADRRLPPRR